MKAAVAGIELWPTLSDPVTVEDRKSIRKYENWPPYFLFVWKRKAKAVFPNPKSLIEPLKPLVLECPHSKVKPWKESEPRVKVSWLKYPRVLDPSL